MRHLTLIFTVLALTGLASAGPLTGITVDSDSGFTNASYPAPRLVDGTSTIFSPATSFGWMRTNPGAWVIFDLGAGGQTFNKIRAYTRNSTGDAGLNLRSATVEISNDKSAWTSLNDYTAPSLIGRDAAETAMADAVTTRYVRITRTDTTNGTNGGRIGEIEFYNDKHLAVWEQSQDDNTGFGWMYQNPAVNTVDNDLSTYGNFHNGTDAKNSFIVDLGSSQDITGFRLGWKNNADYNNPTSGDVYVTDDPTSYGTKVMDWTLSTLADGEWGQVDFASAATGRYLVLNDMRDNATLNTSFAEIEIIPEPATLGLLGIGGLFALRRRRR